MHKHKDTISHILIRYYWPTFIFFLQKRSEIPIFSDCQSTEEPNIAQSVRKVLFVRRKPSEQTGWWNNGACWATANQRGWVLCFRESAENTKLLKRCAHLSNTDDTGLLIHNAAALHSKLVACNRFSKSHCWKWSFNTLFKTDCSDILNNVSVYVFWVNPSITLMGKATLLYISGPFCL